MKNDEGYIIEYTHIGQSVKVTAIDPASGTEASIIGAPSAGEHDLGQLAVRKLLYVMQKGSADD